MEGSVAVGARQGLVDATVGGGGKVDDGGAGCGEAVASSGQAVQNEMVVQVLGNWGHDKIVGLTEIELFDRNASRVRLAKAQVSRAHAQTA